MKKPIIAFLLCITLLALSACGSSNVVDYTGKNDSKEDSSAGEESIGEEVTSEVPIEESEEENIEEDMEVEEPEVEEAAEEASSEASYEANIVKFDITESAFDDGYRYEAIVEFENTGNSNLYITGVTFDIEDANNSLVQSDDMISCCPDVIKPGEKGYLYNQFGSSLEGVTDAEGLQLVPQYVVKTTNTTPTEYEVSEVSLKDDTFGVTAVGRVTNNTEEDNSYLYIQIIYFDAEGNVLGISGTSITEFLAGRTVSFEISGMDLPEDVTLDRIADYRVVAQETFFGW